MAKRSKPDFAMPKNLAEFVEWAEPVEIYCIRFTGERYDIPREVEADTVDVLVELGFSPRADAIKFDCTLSFTDKWGIASATFRALYAFPHPVSPDVGDDILEPFVQDHVMVEALPYLKEAVSSCRLRMGIATPRVDVELGSDDVHRSKY